MRTRVQSFTDGGQCPGRARARERHQVADGLIPISRQRVGFPVPDLCNERDRLGCGFDPVGAPHDLLTDEIEIDMLPAVDPDQRLSEQLVFREISTGAADDLARATDIARAMVLRYGMSDALGNVTYDRDRSPFLQPNVPVPQERNYSEETAEAVDRAVRQLVDGAFQKAFDVLQQNRSLLDRTAAALLETETLDEPAIERLKGEIVTVPKLPAAAAVAAAGSSG